MEDNRIGRVIGLAAVLFILVLLLRPVCAPEVVMPPDANDRAMKVAEDAVALARDANEEADALRDSVGAWYFLSLVAGVMIPVVVAFLLMRYWSQNAPEDVEVFRQLDQLRESEVKRVESGGQVSIE